MSHNFFPAPALPDRRPDIRGRRSFLRALAAGMVADLAFSTSLQAAESSLPVPPSLRAAAGKAIAASEPLVVLASLPGCPYCELVRRSYLLPMRQEGLHAWQIGVTDRRPAILDFAGRPSSGAALAERWKVDFTPTVLFFGRNGEELAPRLIGIAVPDFYGAYLEDSLAQARRKIQAGPPKSS